MAHNQAHCNCEEHHHHGDCAEPSGLAAWVRPALALAMLIAGIALSHAGTEWFGGLVRAGWFLVAFLIVGWHVVKEAIEALRDGEPFSEFMLMSVASLGAFAIGEYPEAVAVMLFYCIGEMLQDRAVDRARDNIRSLVAFKPEKVRIFSDEIEHFVRPEAVAVGTEIVVNPGERVPLDGVLLSADAAFDTAALTGESVPRTIERGDEVLAGMIASESVVRLRVVRPAKESAVERILSMVEQATERKAPAELFIRRFARVYTPAVCLLAALVVAVPWLCSLVSPFTYHFSTWLYRALVFLVISCPCALVISIPLSYFAGIGAASRRGILFKGSNYLDALSHVETVVFDKTGTLTTGRFQVASVSGLSEADLSAVAAIESSSSHPIAKAIVESAKKSDEMAENLRNIPGYGLAADVAGSHYLVGTVRLMEKEGVDCPEALKSVDETIVAVAKNAHFIGHILLSDTLKTDARQAIDHLRSIGVGSVILSGDKQALVEKVAGKLGVDKAYGDLLPQDKAAHIEQIKGEGKQVAFVGDGINDAPVLALSDIGVAMGALGSDMAIETADVVIQNDQPSRVAEAVSLGRRTGKIVRQNIAFAIGVKLAIMLLGVLGAASMWAAVFADVGVALLCVLNSMRLMGGKKG